MSAPSSGFVIGMSLGTVSVFVSSFGETLVRLSSLRAQRAAVEGLEKPPWKRPLWVVGLCFTLCGAPLDTAAALYVPLTSIIILLAVKQPILAVFARIILKERISKLCAAGILGCAGGAALSLTASPQNEATKFESPADFFTPGITVYLLVSLVSLIGLWAFVYYVPARVGKAGVTLQTLAMPLLSAWFLSVSKLFNASIGRLPEGAAWYALEWVWLTIGLTVLAGGVLFVNVGGLERMSTHIFMPIAFGFTAVIMGLQGVLFGEFDGMSQDAFLMWMAGLGIALSGTALVSLGSPKAEEDVKVQEEFLEDNDEWFDAVEEKISATSSLSSFREARSDNARRLEVGREMF